MCLWENLVSKQVVVGTGKIVATPTTRRRVRDIRRPVLDQPAALPKTQTLS